MLKVLEITRKGPFRNRALLEAVSDGVKTKIEFNSVFINNDWISKSEEWVQDGDLFEGLVDKKIQVGEILQADEVEVMKRA